MSHQNEFTTCHSCDFRYPSIRGVCVMCGEPARAAKPAQAASRKESETSARRESERSAIFQDAVPPVEESGSGRTIGIGIAVAVVLLVPLFLVIHNRQTSQATEPVAPVVSTQTQASSEEVTTPARTSRNTVKPVHLTATPQAEPTTLATNDPAELWKGVRGGNAHAAVTLAKLYLEGTSVPQSCEQTHMLLLAASKKGSKAADDLLTGAYAQRCRQNSAQ